MPQPEAGLIPTGLTPKVVWVRGKISAQSARNLNANAAIMLVGPLTDLHDAYKLRALDVSVVSIPQLLAKKKLLEGTTYP